MDGQAKEAALDEAKFRLEDEAKIRATVTDYMEGYYFADAERMERSLHPHLAKRAYLPGPDGKPRISFMSAMELVQVTRKSKDRNRRAEVAILDRYGSAASVKATMAEWVDYMHLVKVGTEWKIINVLWELTPEAWKAWGGGARAA